MSSINTLSASMSGMLAAEAQINAVAANIANLNTPGYKAISTQLRSLPNNGGVAVGPFTSNASAGPVNPSLKSGSNVNLVQQIGQLDKARILYNANAAVVRATSRMTGTLLDMFAPNNRA